MGGKLNNADICGISKPGIFPQRFVLPLLPCLFVWVGRRAENFNYMKVIINKAAMLKMVKSKGAVWSGFWHHRLRGLRNQA